MKTNSASERAGRIRCFVFDIGDTLYPATTYIRRKLEYLRRKYGLPDGFAAVYFKEERRLPDFAIRPSGNEVEVLQATLKRLNLNLNAVRLASEMQQYHWRRVERYFTTGRGKQFVGAVKFLASSGCKVALLSDNSLAYKRIYQRMWRTLGLRFDAFVVSEETRIAKPAKETFDRVLKQLKAKSEEAAYFGDNPTLDGAAEDYGWRFVLVYGFTKGHPDYQGERMRFITVRSLKPFLNPTNE